MAVHQAWVIDKIQTLPDDTNTHSHAPTIHTPSDEKRE